MPQVGLKPTAICLICSTPFYASPGHIKVGWGKFCSISCRTLYWSNGNHPSYKGALLERNCKTCGKIIYVKRSHLKDGEGQFCSQKCRRVARIFVICQGCGCFFDVYPSRITKLVKYCSRRCSSRAQMVARIEVKCQNCGKMRLVLPASLNRSKSAGSFCNQNCKTEYMSKSSRTVNGTLRGTRSSKGGRREDLGIYVRSAWEANWARYLDWLKSLGDIIEWTYEPETFQFTKVHKGSRFYTPDFRVVNKDGSIEYHEVKGYMDAQSATKLKRMAKYFPETTVVIIDKRWYYDVRDKMGRLVPNWE